MLIHANVMSRRLGLEREQQSRYDTDLEPLMKDLKINRRPTTERMKAESCIAKAY